jgi:hypothetical protein
MKQAFPFQDLSEGRRKILKMQKESELVWNRAPAAILPVESANCMQSSGGCNTAGRTEIKTKKWRQHLIFFTLCEPYTHQGLSNHTTHLIWCDGKWNTFSKLFLSWLKEY